MKSHSIPPPWERNKGKIENNSGCNNNNLSEDNIQSAEDINDHWQETQRFRSFKTVDEDETNILSSERSGKYYVTDYKSSEEIDLPVSQTKVCITSKHYGEACFPADDRRRRWSMIHHCNISG